MCFERIQKRVTEMYYGLTREKTKDDDLVESILYGEYVVKNPMDEQVTKDAIESIRYRVYRVENHVERIKLVDTDFCDENFLKFLHVLDKGLCKHEFTATKFKDKSYEFYKKRNFEMAIRCCNLALSFTPADCNLIPGLYADRAFFLHSLNDLNPVIEDVEVSLALEVDFGEALKTELNTLREQCFESCSRRELHKTESESDFDLESEKRAIYRDEVLFKIFGEPHMKIQAAGNYVSIVNHPFKGRIVIVTEDIKAGTTIIVEEPYVSILTESVNWELKHCSRCYKKTRALVQCPNCIHTAYCCHECRTADYKSYHKYECPCLNYFHAVNIGPSMQMGFRAVCKAGPLYMYKLYKQSKVFKKAAKQIQGFNPETGKYDSDSYYQVYHLASHLRGQHVELHTWYAYTIAKLLDIKTKFFKEIDPNKKEGFMEFIASCFLQHGISIPYNVMSLWVDSKPSRQKVFDLFGSGMPDFKDDLDSDSNSAGMNGLFSLGSLMCHSCDPSALRMNLENGKLAIITARALKAGEEVTISYGYEYTTHDLKYRGRAFKDKYRFKCECVACVCKWPMEGEIGRKIEYMCPKCADGFSYEERAKFRQCVLTREHKDMGTCGNCKKEFCIEMLKEKVKKYEDILGRARHFMIRDKPVEAIPLLVESIEFFQSRVMPPSQSMIRAQTLLLCAHDMIAMNTRL